MEEVTSRMMIHLENSTSTQSEFAEKLFLGLRLFDYNGTFEYCEFCWTRPNLLFHPDVPPPHVAVWCYMLYSLHCEATGEIVPLCVLFNIPVPSSLFGFAELTLCP